MKQTIRYCYITTISLMTLLMTSLPNQAGEITEWNMLNVITDPGPYIPEFTYQSHIYDDEFLSHELGSVIWVESDVMSPGLGIVNNDDVNGSNCVMTAGVNPNDLTVKQCSDPFQSSKRFKLSTTSTGGVLDLVFDVDLAGGVSKPYRFLAKYLNSTNRTISDIRIEPGFGLGGDFVPAPGGMGLDFSDRDGVIWMADVNTGETDSINLDALFPFGLFGDAATDPNHDLDGYFDATDRARFNLRANRGQIISTGISANYHNVFGDFLAKSQAISGYFWDHDDDDETDPYLIAHQTEAGWYTLRPDQWWLDFMLPIPDTNLLDGSIAESTLNDWAANPDDFGIDLIEDLANLNLNFHLTIGDISTWPGYDSISETAQFTLRVSSFSVIFANGFD
ncbi:choice-of-anchor F family protein [Marinicella sediminis]|uniref:Choice-of-anchor F family protein n=1 Tax=Marinicella sediminis TaxID=1792834 RepID=A0ABV7JC12_9GAMM|nr:choice-of-anchor F family protein [Marinicella sediminis]